jgi:hypothetical protein
LKQRKCDEHKNHFKGGNLEIKMGAPHLDGGGSGAGLIGVGCEFFLNNATQLAFYV